MYRQRTSILKSCEAEKKWHLVDAQERVVGRLATEIAHLLRGKHNPRFTPHMDSGDFVVVVNAGKVKFTGKKWDEKIYYRHSGHVGGLKQRTAREQFAREPERILYNAVKGMLPKGPLGRRLLTKLKIFVGQNHAHQAQKPVPYGR